MISNSWRRKWLASRDVWKAFDIGTNGYWVSPLVLLEYTHLDEYVPPTYDTSPRLKTITTFCSLFSRKNTRWDLLNHTLMCLNASAFSEIITVLEIIVDADFLLWGYATKKKYKNKNTVLPIFFQVNAELRVVTYEKTFLKRIDQGKNPEQNLSDQNSYVRERISKILEVLLTHPDFLL